MTRRGIIGLIASASALVAAAAVALIELPNTVRWLGRRPWLPEQSSEPNASLRIGQAADFSVGVDTRFLQSHRVFVVRNSQRLYVIYGRCPHKGCTPDWVAGDARFKCPCHESRFCMGSAFDGNGINCEGPALRPLDRAHVEVDAHGNIVADLSRLYQSSSGSPAQFDEPGAYVAIS